MSQRLLFGRIKFSGWLHDLNGVFAASRAWVTARVPDLFRYFRGSRHAWPSAVALLFCLTVNHALGQAHAFGRTTVSPSAKWGKRFTTIAATESGITFTNRLDGFEYYKNMVAHNGAGVAAGDVNGDDLADVFLCNIKGANALYLNGGGFQFEPMLGAHALPDAICTGATLVDVDGDGDNDLLINGVQIGTRLFINDGDGRFAAVENSGLGTTGTTTSMALADVDGDGDLDLYVAHYIDWMHLADPTTRFEYARRGEEWTVTRINGESALKPKWKGRFTVSKTGRLRELPESDRLYLNKGNGTFHDVSGEPRFVIDGKAVSLSSLREWGLAVTFRDVNNDRLPDLYVCNDFASPDRFWLNQGNGRFKLLNHENIRHTSRSSMGVDFTDLNGDGLPDFMLLDMLDPSRAKRLVQLEKEVERSSRLLDWRYVPRFNRNVLMVSQGGPLWFDTAYYSGVEASAWSWNVRFIDADLDGDDDMLVTNGFGFDTMDMDASLKLKAAQKSGRKDARTLYESKKIQPRYDSPNQLFRNDGELRFANAGEEFGFAHHGITYGLAMADLDNDGDLDLITNNLNEAPSLYKNTSQEPRIQVRLKGGVGSKVRLRRGGGETVREKFSGGGYLSGDSGELVFAAGSLGQGAVLEVEWADGSGPTRIPTPEPNSIYHIEKPALAKRLAKRDIPQTKPMFLQMPSAIDFRHFPSLAKDYDENPFLIKRLSATPAPMLVRDFDENGWLDVGFQLARSDGVQVFLNQDGQQFTSVASRYSNPTGLLPNAGWLDGFAVEAGRPSFAGALNGKVTGLTPYQSVRLVLRADIDGNGSVDALFISQDSMLDHPASSRPFIFLKRDEAFVRAEAVENSLGDLGRVSSAILVDMDGDHDADLLVSREAGSIGLYENRAGTFVDISESVGLSSHVGLWQGLALGDFDNDGRPDIAAGNIGRNSPLEPYRESLVFLSRGTDPRLTLFALAEGEKLLPIDDMDLYSRVVDRAALPETYREFSDVDLSEVLKPFAPMKRTEINCLETSIFFNRGGRYERVALPTAAQLSPVSAINVADFDNDGLEDLFLSQNWYSIRPDLGRLDSGAGFVLLGQGEGMFTALNSSRSGLTILGENLNAVVGDFDRDGRVDIVAPQTLGQAHYYLGQAEKRGIRVSFAAGSRLAKRLGGTVRLTYGDAAASPRRWLHSGDGVLAQGSAGLVLGYATWPSEIEFEWANGEKHSIPVRPETHDYVVP